MKDEIICINSYPTVKPHIDATVKTFKESEKLDVDIMYVSHHKKVPKYINDKANHIYVDDRNDIIGFNLPKKYDYLCRPIIEGDWFTGDKDDVIPTHCYAHYLNIKNSIQLSKMLGYKYAYILIHDIDNFFYEDNFDVSFYPMRKYIKNHDMVFYTQNLLYARVPKDKSKVLSPAIFAIDLSCKMVSKFFNMNTIDEYARLHDRWRPWLENKFKNIIPLLYPCTYLELVFTLEFQSMNKHVIAENIPDGTTGFSESLFEEEQPKELEGVQISEYQNISKFRKKLNVVRT